MSVPLLNYNRQTLLTHTYINFRKEVQEKILCALKADRSREGLREKGIAEKGH